MTAAVIVLASALAALGIALVLMAGWLRAEVQAAGHEREDRITAELERDEALARAVEAERQRDNAITFARNLQRARNEALNQDTDRERQAAAANPAGELERLLGVDLSGARPAAAAPAGDDHGGSHADPVPAAGPAGAAAPGVVDGR